MSDSPANPRGPYDVLLFVLSSFGKSLPIIVVIGGVAVGAWYFIKELSQLQTKLLEAERQVSTAEVRRAKAEAGAETAADRARGELMTEQVKRLSELNDASIAVSQKIQALVEGQLQNMEKLEDRTAAQVRAAEERQAEREKAAQAEVRALQAQVTALEARRSELDKQMAVGTYRDVRDNLVQLYSDETRPVFGAERLVELLGSRLQSDEVRAQAAADATATRLGWSFRFVLSIELLKATGDEKYLRQAEQLLLANKQALGLWSGERLFIAYRSQATDLRARLFALAARVAFDDTVPTQGRNSLLGILGQDRELLQRYAGQLSDSARVDAARSAGALFLRVLSEQGYCGGALDVLKAISTPAGLAFAAEALDMNLEQNQTECIRLSLRQWGDPPLPAKAERQQWLR